MYKALDKPNLADHDLCHKLIKGIVKSGTTAPRTKTPVVPIQPLHNMFMQWEDNDKLSVEDLRLKVLCLLGLGFMLRPSDVAPRGVVLDTDTMEVENMIFSVDLLQFHDDGALSINFHGIKNDGDRAGFPVKIPPASNSKLDHCAALTAYLKATEMKRATVPGQPVFISLEAPYHALDSVEIAKILQNGIDRAGMSNMGLSAKSFRPAGASKAIESGCPAKIAQAVGRWKCQEVFEQHYVHTKVPDNYTDNLLAC